jgi:hypothetical protein
VVVFPLTCIEIKCRFADTCCHERRGRPHRTSKRFSFSLHQRFSIGQLSLSTISRFLSSYGVHKRIVAQDFPKAIFGYSGDDHRNYNTLRSSNYARVDWHGISAGKPAPNRTPELVRGKIYQDARISKIDNFEIQYFHRPEQSLTVVHLVVPAGSTCEWVRMLRESFFQQYSR